MERKLFFGLILLCLIPSGAVRAAQERAPSVVVSIEPIHSLVAAVMEGVGEPRLLVRGGSSPHSYVLRPSDARAIDRAQLIVWVGPELESFLKKPLATLGTGAKRLELVKALKGDLLPVREGGVWEEHEDHGEREEHGALDPHFWLGPALAGRAVDAVTTDLAGIDPVHADRYRENAARLKARLGELDGELRRKLEPVREVPFIVFHDGYQYFEKAFSLKAVGSVTVSPDRRPGVRRIGEIHRKIRKLGARCIFSEPQFQPRLVETLTEGTGARAGVLDPLGADLPAGSDAYFRMMRGLTDSLIECLKK